VSSLTDDDAVTIDELARRTGMTVRNIRAHQARGLLPPPDVRGRTGFYGAEHVARIELIKELQADGFNLEAIKKLIDAAPGNSREVLRFTRAVREPFEDEEPEIVEVGELAERFGGDEAGGKLLDQALRLGLLRDLGEGRYEQRSPRLAEAAGELRSLGVSPEHLYDVTKKLHRHADGAGGIAIIASKGGNPKHPAWFHNLKAHPDTKIELPGGEVREVRARVAEGEEREQWWQRAVAAYGPYEEYQSYTDRQIPVVLLEKR
jgi:deazaflavin-dependent oxidoreductase (nitroreductase family)